LESMKVLGRKQQQMEIETESMSPGSTRSFVMPLSQYTAQEI